MKSLVLSGYVFRENFNSSGKALTVCAIITLKVVTAVPVFSISFLHL